MKYEHLEAQARIDTPLGPLLLAATSRGLAGAWFDGQAHHPGALDAPTDASHPHIAAATSALQAYWAGPPRPFSLALDAQGTAFQRAVWQALCEIAPGTTRSYGHIAQRIGRPAAVRAVGAAVGRNPLSLIVPCHRVIGRDGSLTGYAGGLERKRALLLHEGASFTAQGAR
jgi:methylated-DNA-[protein]-cysteine S-methyltransferase